MMYICQIPILDTSTNLYLAHRIHKRTSAQYTMQRSFLILYLIFLCLCVLTAYCCATSLHGEADSAHLILTQAYYSHYIAQSQNIFYMVDSLLGDLGDVYHAFLAGCELDECTELLDADYLTLEDLALFEIGGDDLHHLQSLLHRFLVSTADRYLTIIGDIDLHTGTGNDLIDGLTTLSYYITDSVGIDLNGDDLGSILANLCLGSRDSWASCRYP